MGRVLIGDTRHWQKTLQREQHNQIVREAEDKCGKQNLVHFGIKGSQY